ncbi:TPA: glycosyltransferase [Photobacterium damselae]
MHVHIISPYESPAEGRGTRNIHIANVIGEKCTLVCTRFSHGKKKILSKSFFDDSHHSFNIKTIFTIPYKKNLSLLRLIAHWVTALSVLFYLMKNAKKGDKVLLSSIPPEVLFFALLILKLKSINSVVDVRDIWPDAFPLKGIAGKLFGIYCSIIYKFSFKLSDGSFIYVAPSFKSWIKKYTTIKKSHFGFLGYDKQRWIDCENNIFSKNEINEKDKVKLVYVGYLESQFDITKLIECVNNNNSFELIIIGNGSKESYYKELSQTDRIRFTGLLSPQSVVDELMHSHVGVLPISKTAQMPNKLFDYIGACLPILTIGNSDSRKFVQDNNFGWGADFELSSIQFSLDEINFQTICEKKLNIISSRDYYSKDTSYNKIIGFLMNE